MNRSMEIEQILAMTPEERVAAQQVALKMAMAEGEWLPVTTMGIEDWPGYCAKQGLEVVAVDVVPNLDTAISEIKVFVKRSV